MHGTVVTVALVMTADDSKALSQSALWGFRLQESILEVSKYRCPQKTEACTPVRVDTPTPG